MAKGPKNGQFKNSLSVPGLIGNIFLKNFQPIFQESAQIRVIYCLDIGIFFFTKTNFTIQKPNFGKLFFGPKFFSWLWNSIGQHNSIILRVHFEGSIIPRCALWMLQNSAGQICTQYLPRRILEPSKCAPRNYGAFKVRPAKLWSLQNAPRGVLEQCKVCPAISWRHS